MNPGEIEKRVKKLEFALRETLQWLEHPEVNAIPFAGSPIGLASHIRELLGFDQTGEDNDSRQRTSA